MVSLSFSSDTKTVIKTFPIIATSCCRYYECVNSELREFVCPYPKLFSTETKQCEMYQVVRCGIRDRYLN